MNTQFRFWWRWLIVVAWGVMIFSVALIALPNLMVLLFNTLFFSTSQAHLAFGVGAATYIKFVYGVLGAVMVGWSSFIRWHLFTRFRAALRGQWLARGRSGGPGQIQS